mmetsp:Transcript_21421/g.85208  ORF Transcript_21421/g.85208 Transcript_21421/m.85208 type:complete len:292 (+) Transcript_21421:252-1127(+)
MEDWRDRRERRAYARSASPTVPVAKWSRSHAAGSSSSWSTCLGLGRGRGLTGAAREHAAGAEAAARDVVVGCRARTSRKLGLDFLPCSTAVQPASSASSPKRDAVVAPFDTTDAVVHASVDVSVSSTSSHEADDRSAEDSTSSSSSGLAEAGSSLRRAGGRGRTSSSPRGPSSAGSAASSVASDEPRNTAAASATEPTGPRSDPFSAGFFGAAVEPDEPPLFLLLFHGVVADDAGVGMTALTPPGSAWPAGLTSDPHWLYASRDVNTASPHAVSVIASRAARRRTNVSRFS